MHPTRHFLSILPAGLAASDLADECRSAALGFVAGAPAWDKRRIAEWLELSYRPITLGATATPRHASGVTQLRRLTRPTVDERKLGFVVDVARQAVVAMLRTLSDGAAVADFGAYAIRAGLVHRCIDDGGQPAWSPRATSHIKLADRVLSLFAADCLARPWEYETLLVVCEDCDSVRFVEGGTCCARNSGVMLRAPAARESAA